MVTESTRKGSVWSPLHARLRATLNPLSLFTSPTFAQLQRALETVDEWDALASEKRHQVLSACIKHWVEPKGLALRKRYADGASVLNEGLEVDPIAVDLRTR